MCTQCCDYMLLKTKRSTSDILDNTNHYNSHNPVFTILVLNFFSIYIPPNIATFKKNVKKTIAGGGAVLNLKEVPVSFFLKKVEVKFFLSSEMVFLMKCSNSKF